MHRSPLHLSVLLLPFVMMGCSSADDSGLEDSPGGTGGQSTGGEGTDSDGSGGLAFGGSESGGASAGGSGAGGSEPEAFTPWGMCAADEAAINPVTRTSFDGRGVCDQVTLAEAIARTHEAFPDLADVTAVYGASDDGFVSDSLIYVFEKSNGAFQLAFYQGSGDCPAGCIDSAWTYIEMNEDCEPERAGSFSEIYSGEGNCREVSGTPLWGKPAGRPSINDCGLEDVYADFSGTFEVPFSGTRTPCSEKGGDASEEEVSGTLTMTIEQDSDDPSVGSVTFSGEDLDPEWLGSDPYDVQFDYFQANVSSQWDNLPAMCIESRDVDVTLDFEGCSESSLSMFEYREPECGSSSCKGQLKLELDLSGVQLEFRD